MNNSEDSLDRYMSRLIETLFQHHGETAAIGADELHNIVFREQPIDKINSTRPLRRLITELRRRGYPIGSISRKHGGGYFWATRNELEAWKAGVTKSALKKLAMIRRMKQTSRELSGQSRFNFIGGKD